MHIAFIDNDLFDAGMMDGLLHWLEFCNDVNHYVRTKAYNGVRIPWFYYADGMSLSEFY